jgi:hypothetical protein
MIYILIINEHSTARQFLLSRQYPRMSIHFLLHAFNPQLLRIELHFLAILCENVVSSVQLILNGEPCVCGNLKRSYSAAILNFNCTKLGSFDARGNNFVLTFIPVCRALGGRKERNNRAVFERGENGLKTVDTSVMNLVIIVTETRKDSY